MGKWVGRLFYAIVIVFMTFFIIQSAYDSRSNAYLVENMNGEWDNEAQFFKGVNTLLDLDFMTADPITTAYVDNAGEHQLTLQFFGIGYTDQAGNHLDGIMVFVNHVKIFEPDGTTGRLKEVETPYIKLTIYTDEPLNATSTDTVSYSGFEGQNFAAGFLFDQESEEVAYDLTYYVDQDGNYLSSNSADIPSDTTSVPVIASITRVDVDYSNGESVGGDFTYATESLMIVSNQVIDDPVFDDSFKFTDFSYDPQLYRLQDDLTEWPVKEAEKTALNLFTDRDDLSAYNWEMVRVYLLYAGFVLIVTYLLFFHKKTMIYIRTRRNAKKNNNIIDAEVVESKPQEQIFEDKEPK